MKKKRENMKVGGMYLIRKVGVGNEKIFIDKKDYSRFLLGLEFYNSRENINLWSLLFCHQNQKNTSRVKKDDFFRGFKKRLWEKREENRKLYKRGMKIVNILGFVLMARRYYLLILEIEKGGISKFMHKMGGYSSYFNRRHNRTGVLFRSQYEYWRVKNKERAVSVLNALHAIPIERAIKKKEYFSNGEKTIRKKELLDKLNCYRYSSFIDYAGGCNFASVTNRGFLLDYLRGKENYKKQIEEYLERRADMGI